MTGFHRDDEDWLRAQSIVPYSDEEVAEARVALREMYSVTVAAMRPFVTAAWEAAQAIARLGDQLIAADVDVDCEAATLLDPHAPVADEIAPRSGPPRPHTTPPERRGRGT